MREILKVSEECIRISIRIYEDLDLETCLQFWSKVVNIPKEKFTHVDILAGKKKGKLMYGMCRIRILKGGILLKNIMAINKTIANNLVPIA